VLIAPYEPYHLIDPVVELMKMEGDDPEIEVIESTFLSARLVAKRAERRLDEDEQSAIFTLQYSLIWRRK
jgi:hypothetical protein